MEVAPGDFEPLAAPAPEGGAPAGLGGDPAEFPAGAVLGVALGLAVSTRGCAAGAGVTLGCGGLGFSRDVGRRGAVVDAAGDVTSSREPSNCKTLRPTTTAPAARTIAVMNKTTFIRLRPCGALVSSTADLGTVSVTVAAGLDSLSGDVMPIGAED